MRTSAVVSIVFALVVLGFPAAAGAGWGGSNYEKSQCTRSDTPNGRPGIRCEQTFTQLEARSGAVLVGDASCPSGQRLMRTEQTVEVTWKRFDVFDGPVPHAQFALFGDEFPISQRLISEVITTPLGCAP